MPSIKEKQVKVITTVLGVCAAILLSILGFRFLGEYLTSRASNAAPQNVSIQEISTTSAKVKWTTDLETQSVIEYGTTPTSLTFFAPEGTKTTQHEVELNLLSAGSTYYFQVKVGDQVFDNGGVPWTFTTLEKDADQATSTTEDPLFSPSPSTLPSPTEGVETQTTPTPTEAETPTATPSPTAGTVEKDTECILNEYKSRFYTDVAEYDQDDNGVVNLRDWSVCNSKNN
jgi:hypothetical protein